MVNEIIYFYANVYPKCIRVNQWLKELQKSKQQIKIIKYNIFKNWKLAQEYNVKTIPTVIIGKTKLTGFIDKSEFEKLIKNEK